MHDRMNSIMHLFFVYLLCPVHAPLAIYKIAVSVQVLAYIILFLGFR